jgi:hypothetical protein
MEQSLAQVLIFGFVVDKVTFQRTATKRGILEFSPVKILICLKLTILPAPRAHFPSHHRVPNENALARGCIRQPGARHSVWVALQERSFGLV